MDMYPMSEKTMLPRVGIGKSGYELLLEDEIRKQLGSIGIEF